MCFGSYASPSSGSSDRITRVIHNLQCYVFQLKFNKMNSGIQLFIASAICDILYLHVVSVILCRLPENGQI